MEAMENNLYQHYTTCEEQFNQLCEVGSHYAPVKSRLLEEFWWHVKEKIQALTAEDSMGYNVIASGEDLTDENAKLLLYKPSWVQTDIFPVTAVIIQQLAGRPLIGVWLNQYAHDMDRAKMIAFAQTCKIPTGYRTDDDVWLAFYKEMPVNFNKDRDFLQILPASRGAAISFIAEQAFLLAKEMEPVLDHLSQMKMVHENHAL